MYGSGYAQDPPQGPPGHGYVPPPRRPGSPKVLGILSIVFGSVTIVSSLFGLLAGNSMMMMGTDDLPGMRGATERFMEATRTATLVNSALFSAMSIALIVIGSMQLKYKRAAVKASIAWGAIALGVLVVVAALQFTIVGPATDRMMADMAGSAGLGDSPFSGLATLSAVGSIIFYSPYPILLMILFTRPAVRAAMVN